MLGKNKVQEVNVTVDGGYEPSEVKLKADVPARITFTRISNSGCLNEVILNGEKRELKLNIPEVFEFVPDKKGDFNWTCGMKMAKGTYIVK